MWCAENLQHIVYPERLIKEQYYVCRNFISEVLESNIQRPILVDSTFKFLFGPQLFSIFVSTRHEGRIPKSIENVPETSTVSGQTKNIETSRR